MWIINIKTTATYLRGNFTITDLKLLVCVSCLPESLCNLMDWGLPGSTLCRISQAKIQEWIAIFSSRGSSWPRGWTQVSYIAGRCYAGWAAREAQLLKGRWEGGSKERGYMYTYGWFMLRFDRKQKNSVKQLSSQ